MGSGSVDVELADEAGGTSAPVDRDPTAARRARLTRVLRRWWPVPVVLVAGVVGWQLVADGRDRAATEALRATAGVIGTTLGPQLTATPWGGPDAAALLADPTWTTAGLLVGTTVDDSGEWDLVALDPDDGAEVWRAALRTPDPLALASGFVGCEGDADPARSLACVVLTETYDQDSGAVAVASRLLHVDLATGAVEPGRELPAGASAAVAGDMVVLAESRPAAAGGSGTVTVTATDLASGDPRWRAEVPGAFPAGAGAPGVRWADGHVVVHGPVSVWALDPEDGRVQASGLDLQVLRDGRVVDAPGSTVTRLFGPDGEPGATLDGTPVHVDPDDGSVPDLLVLRQYDGAAGGTLRGVDAATGAELWQVALDRDPVTSLVLLDGVLYVADGPTVRALDAATGEQRWASTGQPDGGEPLLSDGVSLLRSERDMATGDQVLAAYALGDGDRAWATPLPEEAGGLLVRGGRLYGQVTDGLVRID